jgi:uncharacterized SAM-binding protein YcdF (DUF218 family)
MPMGYTGVVLSARDPAMKQILTITVVLAVFAIAIVGSLYIFEVLSYEVAMSNLLKAVAAIVLLGGCSAVIAFLMRSRKEPPN